MNVELATSEIDAELVIHLHNCPSLNAIKQKLRQQLQRLNISPSVSKEIKVEIDLGNYNLNERDISDLENILRESGLFNYQIFPKNSIVNLPTSEMDKSFSFEDMSEYEETTLVCRHLRSGQKLYTKGNLVVLGDVNPGAEVIAGGNILVMGVLRGMAHAGKFGDENTLVAAYRLSPTQLRIADHITRPPDGDEILVNSPELARIRAGKVIIEKMRI